MRRTVAALNIAGAGSAKMRSYCSYHSAGVLLSWCNHLVWVGERRSKVGSGAAVRVWRGQQAMQGFQSPGAEGYTNYYYTNY